jgi:hypothetical protein
MSVEVASRVRGLGAGRVPTATRSGGGHPARWLEPGVGFRSHGEVTPCESTMGNTLMVFSSFGSPLLEVRC